MMQLLLPFLLILLLAGCSSTEHGSREGLPIKQMPVKMYKSAAELAGQDYHELGQVSGSSCQLSPQEAPPNIADARHDMLVSANRLNANGVILTNCETSGGMAGCYRQAICIGTAISFSSQ